MARIFAKTAKKHLGQQFVIINKPGAGGQIGFEAIAKAKPDGYTIGAVFTPHLMAHKSAGRASYTLASFTPLINLVTDPGVLVVNANSPFKTVKDIVDQAKLKPNSLTASTTGAGGDDFFALVKFSEIAGVTIKDIAAKGSSAQKASLLGGHLDMGFMNYSQVEPNVKSGDLRIIAVLAQERLSYSPDTPTMKEQGYDISSDSSRGFVAPAGIPEDVRKILAEGFSKVMKDPEFIKAAEGNLLLNEMTPDAYSKYLNEQQEKTDAAFSKNPW